MKNLLFIALIFVISGPVKSFSSDSRSERPDFILNSESDMTWPVGNLEGGTTSVFKQSYTVTGKNVSKIRLCDTNEEIRKEGQFVLNGACVELLDSSGKVLLRKEHLKSETPESGDITGVVYLGTCVEWASPQDAPPFCYAGVSIQTRIPCNKYGRDSSEYFAKFVTKDIELAHSKTPIGYRSCAQFFERGDGYLDQPWPVCTPPKPGHNGCAEDKP